MVRTTCSKEEFQHIKNIGDHAWLVRFSEETDYMPVFDEEGKPTGEMEDSGFVICTEEVLYGPEVTVEMVRKLRLQELTERDNSAEINEFFYNDISMWYDKVTRSCLNYSLEVEKAAGRTETELYDKSGNCYVMDILVAESLFAQVELYAKDCYTATARHKANLMKLDDVDEILDYNIKTGYPEKLHLNNN